MQDKELSTQELIAQEVGARLPEGLMARVIGGIALLWSLFQLWIASPLPFVFGVGVFNDTETRSIHLAFALLLAFWPIRPSSARPVPMCPRPTSRWPWWPPPAPPP